MPIITAITPQKRNRERVNVYVDGDFAVGLSLKVATDLSVGTTWSKRLESELLQHETREAAKQRAMRLLAYRPRSVQEIRQKLRQKDFPDEVVETVLEELSAKEYLDDLAFATFWVEQRETFKPRGRTALRYELRQKGVARDVIEKALRDLDELSSARAAVEVRASRYAHLTWDQYRRKLAGFLQRRGFGYAVVKQVVEETWRSLASSQTDNDKEYE